MCELGIQRSSFVVDWGFGAADMSQVREMNAIGIFVVMGLYHSWDYSVCFNKKKRGE